MGSWHVWDPGLDKKKTFHEVAFPCYVSQLVSHCMKTNKNPDGNLVQWSSSLPPYPVL